MSAGMIELARHCGVSPGVVKTVLGAYRPDIGEETRALILEDVSFAGYDGIAITQAISPRLTTIRQSSDSIGEEAAKKLIDLIERPGSVSLLPTVVPVELLEGGTVGRPADT